MKRIIIFALAVMLGLGVAAFAADEGRVYFGIEANPLAEVYPTIFGLSFGVDNIQSSALSITSDLYAIQDNLMGIYFNPITWGAKLGLALDFDWLEVIPFTLGISGGLENNLEPARYLGPLKINKWSAHIRFFGDVADGLLILYWENTYTYNTGNKFNTTTVFGVEGEIPLW